MEPQTRLAAVLENKALEKQEWEQKVQQHEETVKSLADKACCMDLTLKMAESALQKSNLTVSEGVKISSTLNHRNCELEPLIIEQLSLADQAQSLRSSLGEMTREQSKLRR